ncbi:hypothetical protein, partial [Galbibacter mesophilus]
MKNRILLFVLLISGFAFSQTTVNLENQCDCTVLKGTAVTAAGSTADSNGVETGDIYINEITGVLYFWNGSSWDLTSGDKVKNQTFVVNTTDGTLVLTDSEGESVSVLLSEIANAVDTNTTNATLTQDGTNLILTDSDNNSVTIPLTDIAAATDTNTTNVSFSVDTATNELVIVDSEGADVRVALADIAALVDTDDQDLRNVLGVGNDAGDKEIIGLLDPTTAQSAATRNYVDSQISANAADGSETKLTDGTTTTITGDGKVGSEYKVEVTDETITSAKISNGTIASEDLAAGAVNAAAINVDVAGTGLTKNGTTGALDVDGTAINGDGNITSTDLTVGGDSNALLGDVTLDIKDDAVTSAKILNGTIVAADLADETITSAKISNGTIASEDLAAGAVNAAAINADVAGTGLTKNGTTGALDVDGT